MCVFCFFFFKQKTAYEMRISDWSSDVCSSDLQETGAEDHARGERVAGFGIEVGIAAAELTDRTRLARVRVVEVHRRGLNAREQFEQRGRANIARARDAEQDRKSTRLNSSH